MLFAIKGNDAETQAAFADDLAANGGDPAAIDEVCISMSSAFITGIAESLRKGAITFDKFHAASRVSRFRGKVDAPG